MSIASSYNLSNVTDLGAYAMALEAAITGTPAPYMPPTIDTGSNAFMMLSSALVLLMTPGVAFFYGGLVSDRSVLTMMMQSYVAMGAITMIWWFIGFGLAFGNDCGGVIGDPGKYIIGHNMGPSEVLVVNGVVTGAGVVGYTIDMYQLTFAIITPTLMTGAFADRLRFKPYVIFIILWHILVYCPFAHLSWGGGWFFQWGVWDFAGGTVVHITSGWSALGSLAVLGKRPDSERIEEKPHNVPFVVLGASLLWFGWFGFNAGSALSSGGPSAAALLNSQLAAGAALFSWTIVDYIVKSKPTLTGACLGSVAGLVVVTPCAGFVQPWAAIVLGLIATTVCYSMIELRRRVLSKYIDDALDVWGCHGMGGFAGAVFLGALADPPECNPGLTNGVSNGPYPTWCVNPNTVSRSGMQFGKQLCAAVICAGYCMIITPIMLKLLGYVMILQPGVDEDKGVDEVEHGEMAYHSPSKNYSPQKELAPTVFL